MHVLITGGAGFIGSSLGLALLQKGIKVTSLDNFNNFYNPQHKRRNIKRLSKFDSFVSIEGDIRDLNIINKVFKTQFDIVIHLACISNDPSFELNPELPIAGV